MSHATQPGGDHTWTGVVMYLAKSADGNTIGHGSLSCIYLYYYCDRDHRHRDPTFSP